MATAKATGASKTRTSGSKGSSTSTAKKSGATAKSSASPNAKTASSNGKASRPTGKGTPVKKVSAAAKAPKAPASRSKSKGTSASIGTKSTSARSTRKATQDNKGMLSTIADAVSGLFSSKYTSQNAVDLLKADHDVVEGLFEQVKANEDGNNAAVFKKIKSELDTHTHIEETIFYPFLLDKGKEDIKKIVWEGIEEHRQAKMFLSELSTLAGTADKFKAKLKVLMEDIEHHVQEEEDEMFPMVEDQFSKDVLHELGARMEAEKAAFKKGSRTTTVTGKRVSSKAA